MSFFDELRRGCQYVAEHSTDVKIDHEAIGRWVSTVDAEQFRKFVHAPQFPLRFTSREEEVNFYACLNLINFGSGFRHALHARKGNDRGAYETIMYGLLSAYLHGEKLDMTWMSSLDETKVGMTFEIPVSQDVPTRIAGVYESKDSDLKPLVDMIVKAFNQAGGVLQGRRFNTLGALILSLIEAQGAAGPLAEPVVRELCTLFPAFADKTPYKGQDVWIAKKAVVLMGDLYYRFRNEDSRFAFKDMHVLSAPADNVVPAVLRQLGILRASDDLTARLEARRVVQGDAEVELRALAVLAIDEMTRRVREAGTLAEANAVDVGYYLWRLGKESEFRAVERQANPDTWFY